MALVRNVSWLFYFVLFAFVLNGCLLADKAKKELSSSSGPSWFEGVSKVTNKAGSPPSVKIEWPKAERSVTGYRVYALMENPDTRVNEWQVLDETTSEQFSYTHSNVTSGKVYAYRVKALDDSGEEDSNTKQLSTVVFEGIAGVRITGKTTATISLNSSLGAFDEVRVYATPKRAGGTKQLVATARGNVQNISVNGLKSGMNYRFSASAYMSYLNSEDGNDLTIEGQTFSESFGSGLNSDNDYAYRGVFSFMGYGDAPNEEVGPSTRRFLISWLPFNNAGPNTKYRLIRTSGGSTLDTTTSSLCISTITSSCVVCEVTGAGTQTCTDENIAAAPKKYDYAITLVKTDSVTGDSWTEELPKDNAGDFKITAHVPPDYMVLVQRDAANYEMCATMQRSPNARKKQRCTYQGIGATPYNSGPGKSPLAFDYGFYDFGYNLFINRHKLACNWSRNSCGPNGCIADTTAPTGPIVPTAPDNGVGNDGDVFFALNFTYGHNCYYRKAGAWLQSRDPSLTETEINTTVTIDPGPVGMKHRPTIMGISAPDAFRMCNATSTPYGKKRLLRRRESMVANTLPYLEGEPNAITDLRTRVSIERSFLGYSNFECGLNFSNAQALPTNLSQLLSPTNYRGQMLGSRGGNLSFYTIYFTGTVGTKNCVSRWGVQDYNAFDRGASWNSDSFVRTSISATDAITMQSESSELDSGARDFATYRVDGNMGPNYNKTTHDAGASYQIFPTNSISPGNSYILPLGVPIVNWVGLPQDTWSIVELFNRSFFGYKNIKDTTSNDLISLDANSPTRFYTTSGFIGRSGLAYVGDNINSAASALCAVEAE